MLVCANPSSLHSYKKQDFDSKYQFVPATKILEDEELFIDYGSQFFPINKKEEEDSVILPSTYCVEHASDSTYSNISKDEDSGLD